MALEARLTKAIKDFIGHTKVTGQHIEVPGETEQTQLLEILSDAIDQASKEGHGIVTGQEQRNVSIIQTFAWHRASQIVSGIIDQIRDKVADFIDAFLSNDQDETIDEDALAEQVEEDLGEWAESYADMVAVTEIHGAVEEAVHSEMKAQGVTKIYWNTEPGACKQCIANEEASPINIDAQWPGGDTVPPAHPNCRCTTSSA